MPFVFAQVVAVLLILQPVPCSQAAGVLRNATIDNQDSCSRYSSGWTRASSENATYGIYAFTNTVGESIEIELPANVTNLYFLGYNGHANFAACLDCNSAVGRQLVVVRESGQPALNVDLPAVLFSMSNIDPASLHSLSIVNLCNRALDRQTQITFDSLIVTVLEDLALTSNINSSSDEPQPFSMKLPPSTRGSSPRSQIVLSKGILAARADPSPYPASNPSYSIGSMTEPPVSMSSSQGFSVSYNPSLSSTPAIISPYPSAISRTLTIPSSAFPTLPPISPGSSLVFSFTLPFDPSSMFPPIITSFPVSSSMVSSPMPSMLSGSASRDSSSISSTSIPSSSEVVSSSMASESSHSVSLSSSSPSSSQVSSSSIISSLYSSISQSISTSLPPTISPTDGTTYPTPLPSSSDSSLSSNPSPSILSTSFSSQQGYSTDIPSSSFSAPSISTTISSSTPLTSPSSVSSSASGSGTDIPSSESAGAGTVTPRVGLSASIIIVVAILSSLAVLSILFGVVMLLLRSRSRAKPNPRARFRDLDQDARVISPYMTQRSNTPPVPPVPPGGFEAYRNSYTTRFFGSENPVPPPRPRNPYAGVVGASIGIETPGSHFAQVSPPGSQPNQTTNARAIRTMTWVARTPRQIPPDELV